MKLVIEKLPDCPETEIRITCTDMDERLQRLVEQIRVYTFSIEVRRDGLLVPIPLEDVFYFDTADDKTFLYLQEEVYPCDKKLYELENALADTTFVRVSKNCILNSSMVMSVRAQLSGRLEATLANGEKIIVSKHYIKSFRAMFER